MTKIIQGNILDVSWGLICHQVNCQHVAGAGLALQIRNKYYGWYSNYKNHPSALGEVGYYKVSLNPNLWIANLYSQFHYTLHGCVTNYTAFEDCLNNIKEWYPTHTDRVYFPYGIGCGLAGGDWNIILSIIERIIPEAVIVKLGE